MYVRLGQKISQMWETNSVGSIFEPTEFVLCDCFRGDLSINNHISKRIYQKRPIHIPHKNAVKGHSLIVIGLVAEIFLEINQVNAVYVHRFFHGKWAYALHKCKQYLIRGKQHLWRYGVASDFAKAHFYFKNAYGRNQKFNKIGMHKLPAIFLAVN